MLIIKAVIFSWLWLEACVLLADDMDGHRRESNGKEVIK